MKIRNFETVTLTAAHEAAQVIERNIIGMQQTQINLLMEKFTDQLHQAIKQQAREIILKKDHKNFACAIKHA